MRVVDLRQKSKSELRKIIGDSQEELRQLKFNLASGKVKNVKDVRRLRKDIAKVKTILREKD